jgi:hypothetical protein
MAVVIAVTLTTDVAVTGFGATAVTFATVLTIVTELTRFRQMFIIMSYLNLL